MIIFREEEEEEDGGEKRRAGLEREGGGELRLEFEEEAGAWRSVRIWAKDLSSSSRIFWAEKLKTDKRDGQFYNRSHGRKPPSLRSDSFDK